MTPKFLTHNLKLLFAAHHFVFNSKDPKAIADVLKVKKSKIQWWMKSHEWLDALAYWQGTRQKQGDFGLAEQAWTEMIENGEDLLPFDVEHSEKPRKSPRGNDPFYTLIHSHLFCAVDLCDEQIRARLAEEREFESEPVRYEGQALGNRYRWWLYPNYDDGIYSKTFARANAAGNLVIGTGEDTCLIIIRHGRLTISRQAANDVANISDARLLVCL